MTLWFAFCLASIALLVVPGPTVLTVVGYSLGGDRGRAWRLAMAVVLGDATAVVLSLAGLGAVLSVSSAAFSVMKWAGALLLVVIGLRWLFSSAEPVPAAANTTRERWFLHTYLVTALNPKGILFFSAFLPQFVDPTRPIPAQLLLLGTSFVLLAGVNTALYAVSASQLSSHFRRAAARQHFRRVAGTVLIAAGLLTAAYDRRS